MRAMIGSAKLVAFTATTDGPRARAFYERVLGLTCVSDDDVAVVFDASGTTLRVTKLEQHTPLPFTVLGWDVNNVEAAVKGLAAKGVTFERYPGMEQDELALWRPPGAPIRIAWFKDPDGNLLSLSGP
jgi:catechol 2,3-dioxygenase-like lactoylglutathione lyase family enzyme